jgi:hypothetical protein
MLKSKVFILALLVAAAGLLVPAHQALAGKPNIHNSCTSCHEGEQGVVRGKLVSHSARFASINVDAGIVWIMKYNAETAIDGVATMADIPKGKEITVSWTGTEANPVATKVVLKKEIAIPEDQQVNFEQMREYVIQGPRQGNYLLVDSRPPGAFNEGHIPHAVNIPFPMIKKQGAAVLPQDKDMLVIFYCGGFA